MTTCGECGYNLPHHDSACSSAPKYVALCPAHAPRPVADRGSDDARLTCKACRATGQHVGLFSLTVVQ